MTDVTGFGLLGHALEMARGAGLRAKLRFSQLPLLEGVMALARGGCITGASARNWEGCAAQVNLHAGIDAPMKALLTDPQTSGGLLVACRPDAVTEVLGHFSRDGFEHARVIGTIEAGTAGVDVE
jgi:selenide,water dikinase